MSGLAGLIQDMGVLAAEMTGSSAMLTRNAPGAYDATTGASVTGTITTGLSAKAATAVAVGAASVVCTTAPVTGACDLKTDDFVTFAGDNQPYTLAAAALQAAHAADVTLAFAPPLKKALAGGEAVTVHSSASCACFITPDASSLVGLGFKFGKELVQAGDLKCDIPNKGLTLIPTPGDKITATLDGVASAFTIIDVQPDYFQGEATNYSCLVRR